MNPYLDRELLYPTKSIHPETIFDAKKNRIPICTFFTFNFMLYIFSLLYTFIGLYYLSFPILRVKHIKINWWMIDGYFIYIPLTLIVIWIIMICLNGIKLNSLDIIKFSLLLYCICILAPVLIRAYIIYKIIDITKLYLKYKHIHNICSFIYQSTSPNDKENEKVFQFLFLSSHSGKGKLNDVL
eukprot:283949_1